MRHLAPCFSILVTQHLATALFAESVGMKEKAGNQALVQGKRKGGERRNTESFKGERKGRRIAEKWEDGTHH